MIAAEGRRSRQLGTGAGRPPNFVVVVLDDVRFDDLGFAGHPFVRTPNFDRVAADGVSFSRCFASTPLCSPNRACILTGQHARVHGILDNTDRSRLSRRLLTFPAILRRAGYETAFIGKWHMGLDDGPRPGFDDWLCLRGQGDYFDPEVNDNGERRVAPGYATDIFSRRAADFIRRERDRPFLVCLSHKAVHPNLFQSADGRIRCVPEDGGFVPPPGWEGLYTGESVPRRPNAKSFGQGKPALLRPLPGVPPLGPRTGTPDSVIRNRLRILSAADAAFAAVLEALEDNGQSGGTVVVVTSDHGYFYGEHGLNEERRLAYEESARVPLALRWPDRIAAGGSVPALASSIDLAPTVLELAGLRPHAGMRGASLAPLLGGTVPRDWRRSVLIEYFSDSVWPRMASMGYQAVRTRRWKYIRYAELSGMDEIYDLQADPWELRNLCGDSGTAEIQARLAAELDRLVAQAGAGRLDTASAPP